MKRIIPSKNSTRSFLGKPITLEEALETTHQVADYYEALKYNRKGLPPKPTQSLAYILRCNAIAKIHHTQINLGLKMGFKRNYLEHDEVVFAWLVANHGQTEKPVFTLGSMQLKFHDNSIAV